jgi:hypothetical protein
LQKTGVGKPSALVFFFEKNWNLRTFGFGYFLFKKLEPKNLPFLFSLKIKESKNLQFSTSSFQGFLGLGEPWLQT